VPRLICTVRNCGLALQSGERVLRCAAGHSFDRARNGVWNLLQPQDRRSSRAGDSPRAVEARGRWLERGYADGLASAIAAAAGVDSLAPGATVLDVGCGEGWFCGRLFGSRDVDLCGIDLSTAALRRSARRLPRATWIAANADRGLPVAPGSVDLALSIFGRRPAAELARVVRVDGGLVVVAPGDDDLAELREAAQSEARPLGRAAAVLAELATTPFRLRRRETWRCRVPQDAAALADALAMSYRGARERQRIRLRNRLPAGQLAVTLAAEILAFRRDAGPAGLPPPGGPGTGTGEVPRVSG
jgi:23S rRNA (guanine745-N1)-methyltransferase